MTTEKMFFELLQVAVGQRQNLSSIPSSKEWWWIKSMAEKQFLKGIAFHGLERLPKEQRPERDILLEWIAQSEFIIKQNIRTTNVCKALCEKLDNDGFKCCILKGQANHAYYGKELGPLRVCGDIDIWIVPQNKTLKHPVNEVLTYFEKKNNIESLCWLHIEVKPVNQVPVEVHLRPSFFNSPIRNKRLLSLFDFDKCVVNKYIDEIELPVLKTDYDVIFQLNHLYRHLIDEGVGLRQVLDYYMLLKTWHTQKELSKEEVIKIVDSLGMKRFSQALMYVLQVVFNAESSLLLCTPSEKDGRFLLNEIMTAGNFGHYDPRMKDLAIKKGALSYQLNRTYRRFKRNFRFLTSYPEEVIFEPIARASHFIWRKFRMWRF